MTTNLEQQLLESLANQLTDLWENDVDEASLMGFLPNFAKGARVFHSMLGHCTVEKVAGHAVIVKDKAGRIIESRREENIIKIFAKEILSHRATYSKVWDPTSHTWVNSGINIDDFAPKYIVFGASFDENYIATDTADVRFYQLDNLNNTLPIALSPGAAYQGGLINPIPVAEPNRPLKRVERVFFEPSYQPAGTPFLQDDVRAINNVVVYETVLRKEEYNGLGSSSYFTITEVALVGAPEISSIGSCECDPRTIFLEGKDGMPLLVNLVYGSTTISLDPSVTGSDVNIIKEGDQIEAYQLVEVQRKKMSN